MRINDMALVSGDNAVVMVMVCQEKQLRVQRLWSAHTYLPPETALDDSQVCLMFLPNSHLSKTNTQTPQCRQ